MDFKVLITDAAVADLKDIVAFVASFNLCSSLLARARAAPRFRS
jgi:hypothetical protein